MKATVENPRAVWGKKLSPKEKVEGAHTVLRGSVMAPEGFPEGKLGSEKPRGRSSQGFVAQGLPEKSPEGALTLPRSTV